MAHYYQQFLPEVQDWLHPTTNSEAYALFQCCFAHLLYSMWATASIETAQCNARLSYRSNYWFDVTDNHKIMTVVSQKCRIGLLLTFISPEILFDGRKRMFIVMCSKKDELCPEGKGLLSRFRWILFLHDSVDPLEAGRRLPEDSGICYLLLGIVWSPTFLFRKVCFVYFV